MLEPAMAPLPDNVLAAACSPVRGSGFLWEKGIPLLAALIDRKFFLTLGQDTLPGNFYSWLPALVFKCYKRLGFCSFWELGNRTPAICYCLQMDRIILWGTRQHSLDPPAANQYTLCLLYLAMLRSFAFPFSSLSSISQTHCSEYLLLKWNALSSFLIRLVLAFSTQEFCIPSNGNILLLEFLVEVSFFGAYLRKVLKRLQNRLPHPTQQGLLKSLLSSPSQQPDIINWQQLTQALLQLTPVAFLHTVHWKRFYSPKSILI